MSGLVKSGHVQRTSPCPLSAKSGLVHRNKLERPPRGGLSEVYRCWSRSDTRNLPSDALPRLLPVNRSAERGQRIQIRRRVVTDQIDRPCAKQEKRRSDGDDGGPDHGATLLLLLPVWIRSESCVMCVGLLCFRHNIANAHAD